MAQFDSIKGTDWGRVKEEEEVEGDRQGMLVEAKVGERDGFQKDEMCDTNNSRGVALSIQ